MKKQLQKQKGFTLIELLVTISIMVVLLTVFVVNFSSSSLSRNLNVAINNFSSTMHKAQTYALASHDYTLASSGPGTPSSAYGVIISNVGSANTYSFVAYDNSATTNCQIVNTSTVPLNIKFGTISVAHPDGTNTTPTTALITFSVPYGRLYVGAYTGSCTQSNMEANDIATITLTSTDGTVTGTVKANGITGNVTQ